MSDWGMYLWLIGAALAISFVIWTSAKNSKARRQAAMAAAAAQAARDHEQARQMEGIIQAAAGDLTKLPDVTSEVSNLMLRPGERCYAICRGAQHITQGHRTRYVGRTAGVSFRVAKGVRLHTGGFSGQPVTTTFDKVQDVGDLYVTSLRVAFCGGREVLSIERGKIAEVRVDFDRLLVIAENRKTPMELKLTASVAPFISKAIWMLAGSRS
jgi:hypothetical protein